jgi:hypothetical protein
MQRFRQYVHEANLKGTLIQTEPSPLRGTLVAPKLTTEPMPPVKGQMYQGTKSELKYQIIGLVNYPDGRPKMVRMQIVGSGATSNIDWERFQHYVSNGQLTKLT